MTLLEYLRILRRWGKFIFFVTALSFSVVLVKGVATPRVYAAYLTALIPNSGSSLGNVGQLIGLQSLAGNSQFAILFSMIQSRRMSRDVIEHFHLQERYPGASLARLERQVSRNVDVFESKAILIVKVTADDAQLAADMANFYAENLEKLNEDVGVTTSRPMVRVLDAAIPPLEYESRKIKEKLLVTLMTSFGASTLFAFFVEYFKRLKAQEAEQRRRKLDAEESLEEDLLLSRVEKR